MKRIYYALGIMSVLMTLSIWSCENAEPEMDTLITAKVSEIEHTSALGGGAFALSADVVARGVCWSSTNELPTLEDDNAVARKSETRPFACRMSDLTPSTEYWVRAYVQTSSSVMYGDVVQFTTAREPGMPEVGKVEAAVLTESDVVLSAPVIFHGGLKGEPTVRGFYYSREKTLLEQMPPAGDIKPDSVFESIEAMDPLSDTVELTVEGLIPNTQYYCRAFITNDFGTGYGEISEFTTPEKKTPIVTIVSFDEATMVSYTSARCIAEMTYGGASPVVEKGVCLGTTNKPAEHTIKSVATDTEIGQYEIEVPNLEPNTIYYMWSYAENSNGISYSEQSVTFQTLPITPPVLESAPYAMNITMLPGASNSVDVSAEVIRTGGSDITERGFCWGTTSDPVAATGKTVIPGTELGVIETTVTGLLPDVVYYIFPYAVNTGEGKGYGTPITFKIPDESSLVLIQGTTYVPKCLSGAESVFPDYYVSKLEVTTDEFAEFLTAYGATNTNLLTKENSDYPNQPLVVYNADPEIPTQASVQYIADSKRWTAFEGREGMSCGFISWYGAYEFAKWKGGRLPSAAMWEYAARGASLSKGYVYSGSDDVAEVGWTDGASLEAPAQKKPNELGLYDMTGNAWEWILEVRDETTGYRKGGSINEKASSAHHKVEQKVSTINRIAPNWNMGLRFFREKE